MKIEKALIVYNKPLYELLILEEKAPYYLRLLRAKHPSTRRWKEVYEQHAKTLEGVERTLSLLGVRTDRIFRKDLKKISDYDLVLTVGGDGTFLEASHFCDKQILLGVNAVPSESHGALCYAQMDNFLGTLVDLMTRKIKPKIVPRLKVRVGNKTLSHPALNEVLFANRSPAGTSRYIIQVGQKKEEQKSSGVWISTGAGSTAAMRSAGGKRLAPTFAGMQYLVRELLVPEGHTYKIRQGVLPKGKSISLVPTTRQSAVFVDGNHIEVDVEFGEKVTVSANGRPLKAVL